MYSFPQDVYIKGGYTPSEQIGIAMLALQDAGKLVLIEWTRQVRRVQFRPNFAVLTRSTRM